MRDSDADLEPGARAPIPVTAAVCGLPCEACILFIASHEQPEMIPALAKRWQASEEEMHCDGCRAERRGPYCKQCELYACAAKRSHAFCVECADYPCPELKGFQSQAPHRAELFGDLRRIAEVGALSWHAEVRERYACPSCGTLNSAYHLRCRTCGHDPASEFVTSHREAVLQRLSQL